MLLASKKEFVEKTGINMAMSSILLDRFCPEAIMCSNRHKTGGGNGRHYKYKVKKSCLQKMICHAYDQSTYSRRECDREKWHNAYESLKELEHKI